MYIIIFSVQNLQQKRRGSKIVSEDKVSFLLDLNNSFVFSENQIYIIVTGSVSFPHPPPPSKSIQMWLVWIEVTQRFGYKEAHRSFIGKIFNRETDFWYLKFPRFQKEWTFLFEMYASWNWVPCFPWTRQWQLRPVRVLQQWTEYRAGNRAWLKSSEGGDRRRLANSFWQSCGTDKRQSAGHEMGIRRPFSNPKWQPSQQLKVGRERKIRKMLRTWLHRRFESEVTREDKERLSLRGGGEERNKRDKSFSQEWGTNSPLNAVRSDGMDSQLTLSL